MMRYNILFVIFGVCVVVSFAWSRHYDTWSLARRSRMCAGEQEVCLLSTQCCEPLTCVKPMRNIHASKRDRPLPVCKNIDGELDGTKAWKPAGAECEDSSQCADLCCRVIRGFRGTLQLCGRKDGPFMCVQKVDNQHVVFGK